VEGGGEKDEQAYRTTRAGVRPLETAAVPELWKHQIENTAVEEAAERRRVAEHGLLDLRSAVHSDRRMTGPENPGGIANNWLFGLATGPADISQSNPAE